MNCIFFLLVLLVNTTYAGVDIQSEKSSKRAISPSKMSYWAAEEEEKQQKRSKKFRLGSGIKKEGSSSKQRLVPMKISSLEEKMSLSKEPHRYNPESNNGLKPLTKNTNKLIAQVRRPDYLPQ
jgi:hypothetical protein